MLENKMNITGQVAYIFTRKQKVEMVLLLGMIIIAAFMELVGVSAILPFVNVILNPEKILGNPYLGYIFQIMQFSTLNNFIIFMAVLLIVIYVLKNVYVYYMHSMQYRFTYDNQRVLAHRMLNCYVKQPYQFHLNHNSAELSRNINDDTTTFFDAVLSFLQLLSEISVCITLMLFLLWQDVFITMGILLLVGGLGFVFAKIFKRQLKQAGENNRGRQEGIRRTAVEILSSIKEIKVLNRETVFVRNYDNEYKEYAECNRKFKVCVMAPKPVMETLCIAALMTVISVKMYLGVDPQTFIPTLSVFAVAAFRMLPSINRISEYMSRIIFCRPAIEAIYHDLKEIENLKEKTESKEESIELKFEQDIKVDNISFHYPNVEKNVFTDVTLSIPKNKSVAFIGPSGQGKTTMADIILGLLEPQKGAVLVDGVDIREGMHAWNRKIGYIPQTISLLDASIRDNILFGIEKKDVNEKRLEESLKEAQLKDFIDTLEEGLDTVIGEGGVRLSGGQRQRIGIARALYHNPEVLVLDEATSALDNDTEAAVMEAIDYLAGSKTLIIIAHRLSTIRNCDLVYRIEGGQVTLQP